MSVGFKPPSSSPPPAAAAATASTAAAIAVGAGGDGTAADDGWDNFINFDVVLGLLTQTAVDLAAQAGFTLPQSSGGGASAASGRAYSILHDLHPEKLKKTYFCQNFDPNHGHILFGRGSMMNIYFAAHVIHKLGKKTPQMRQGRIRDLVKYGEITPYNSLIASGEHYQKVFFYKVEEWKGS
jgi:hypothetical protein